MDPTAVRGDTNHALAVTLLPLPAHKAEDLNKTLPGGTTNQNGAQNIQQTPQNRGTAVYVPSPLPSPSPVIQPSSGEPLLPTDFYTSQY